MACLQASLRDAGRWVDADRGLKPTATIAGVAPRLQTCPLKASRSRVAGSISTARSSCARCSRKGLRVLNSPLMRVAIACCSAIGNFGFRGFRFLHLLHSLRGALMADSKTNSIYPFFHGRGGSFFHGTARRRRVSAPPELKSGSSAAAPTAALSQRRGEGETRGSLNIYT